MGKIDRLKRITLGRIEAFLDSLEKPEYILPQLVKEMGQLVTEATNAKAKSLSAVNSARRRLDEANGKVLRLENGTKLAVQADDLKTARQAISVQIQAEQDAGKRQAELELAEKAYLSASEVCAQLIANLKTLKEKKAAVLKQHRQQQLTKELQKTYSRSIIEPRKDIFDAIVRMETKIEQQETEFEVQNELTKTLGVCFNEERIQKFERDAQVDQRLYEIKMKLGKMQ
jgi:phage shock protein A